MSAKWEQFPMYDARPVGIYQFGATEIDELQMIIATQVSDILSTYGTPAVLHVADPENENSEDRKLFSYLTVGAIMLLDGNELTIEQIPELQDYTDASAGYHCVTISNQEYDTQQCYAIWDPEFDVEGSRIVDIDYVIPSLATMQELYEAMVIATYEIPTSHTANEVDFDTTAYPIAVVEPVLEALEADL